MEVIEAIRRKRAVRKYAPTPLPEEVVNQILYAGRRSQSSKNSQPWRFIAVRDKDSLAALSQFGDYAKHLPSAALAVAILTPDPKALVPAARPGGRQPFDELVHFERYGRHEPQGLGR